LPLIKLTAHFQIPVHVVEDAKGFNIKQFEIVMTLWKRNKQYSLEE
jgi:hypothetical protein